MQKIITDITAAEGDLDKFTLAYKDFGLRVQPDNSIKSLEWAPSAQKLYLKGDFSKALQINSSRNKLRRRIA